MRVTNESTTLITFQIVISTFEIWNEKQNQNKNSRSGVLQWQALQHKLKIWIQTMLTYNYDVYVCSNVSYQFIFVQLHVQPIHFLLTLVRQFHQHSRRNKNKTTQTLDIIITRTKTTPMSNIVCLWLLSPRSDQVLNSKIIFSSWEGASDPIELFWMLLITCSSFFAHWNGSGSWRSFHSFLIRSMSSFCLLKPQT